ncbi:hypothetical protein GCM10009122_39040 [Fulvivirga kasyanovii]
MRKLPYVFSADFEKRILSYRRWEDAQLSLLGRFLLSLGFKKLGKDFYEANIEFTAYKKPYYKDGDIQFNLSHSAEVVVCALTAGEFNLGIDIEKIQPIDFENFRCQMTDKEWFKVSKSPDQCSAFYTYWTQKEAAIKAHGDGLHLPLSSFEVIEGRTLIGSQNFYVKEVEIEESYECHIASNKSLGILRKEKIELSYFL